MLLQNGKYKSKVGGQPIIYKTESGALCLAIPCEVTEGEFSGTSIKHTMTLVNREGAPKTRTVDTLKAVFTYDGSLEALYQLIETDLSEKPFEIVVDNETLVDEFSGEEKTVSKVKWLNPLGGMGMKMPEMADRRSVLSEYGAKFRALATPVKTQSAPRAPSAPAAPQPAKPVVTPDEAWGECVKVNGANAETVWLAELKRLNITDAPTPAQCAELKSIFADDVPFDFPPTPTAPPQPAATPQPKPSPATAAVLSESEIIQLETALTACPDPKRAVDYMKHRGWIPADGKLENCARPAFVNITTRTPAFVRMVEGWKG